MELSSRMTKADLRKTISDAATQHILSRMDNTGKVNETVEFVDENGYCWKITKFCVVATAFETYFEDFCINVEGIMENKNICSQFFIEKDKEAMKTIKNSFRIIMKNIIPV